MELLATFRRCMRFVASPTQNLRSRLKSGAFTDRRCSRASGLALDVDRPDLAESLIEKAAGNLDTAEVAAARGEIAARSKAHGRGTRQFKRAVIWSRDAEAWFQYANLGIRTSCLVVEINPDFAEAHFLLGERLTDDGDFTRAIAHLREAVRVRPRDSFLLACLATRR